MTFVASIALLSVLSLSLASFLAVGPPAAPNLAALGSASSFKEESLDHWPPRVRYASNYTTGATQSGYFWLADPSWNHKVD
jgi:hypothetical protein